MAAVDVTVERLLSLWRTPAPSSNSSRPRRLSRRQTAAPTPAPSTKVAPVRHHDPMLDELLTRFDDVTRDYGTCVSVFSYEPSLLQYHLCEDILSHHKFNGLFEG